MSSASDNARQLFLRATMSDADFGYPDAVAFLSIDMEGWEDVLTRTIFDEGKAVVLVDEEATELLIEPAPRLGLRGFVDQRRGRRRIRVRFRHGTHAYGLNDVTVARADLAHLDLQQHPQLI